MASTNTLTKAINKAIANGWPWELNPKVKPDDIWIMLIQKPLKKDDRGYILRHEMDAPFIIFRHDFAKALWGDGWNHTSTQPNWCYHLQQMVISDSPLEYLEQHI